MFDVKIFNKEIKFRDHYCQLDDSQPLKVREPYTNVYVSLTNSCNALCKFCCNEVNKNNYTNFNFKKFQEIINHINDKMNIHKCSFTGGEPTLQINQLFNCLEFIKETNNNIFTVINTNGTHLDELKNMLPLINSIALSRHHYNDDINFKIFQNKLVPTTNDIANFPDKTKLHLSCNLMKDYIGTPEEVIKYLEWVSTTGCDDVGFVSLMTANKYCKEQFIDFKDLDFENTNSVFITKSWNYQNLCRCRNYNYIAQNAEIIDVYARYYVNSKYSGNALVFDGEYLRLGFNGEIIY